MAKPCAVFWDIQNVSVPRGQSVNSMINLIRSTIIKPFNLNEIFFFCVCDIHKLPSNIGHSLTNLDVDIVQAYNGIKDSADIKIIDLMRKFVKLAGQDCTIILLSGGGDYYGTLNDLKKLHNVSIHLIRLANSFSPKLDQISDYTFMLSNGVLKPVKLTGDPMYYISVKNYPLSINIGQVMNELNAQATRSIDNSAILHDNSICIGFPTLWNAEKAIEQLNRSRYRGHFLKVELIVDSPLTEILKCIKPNVTMLAKSNSEVKQLTFIKMNNPNEADTSKIIKFCLTCTSLAGSQCILSRKSFIWIVFSLKSDAQKFLPKVQIIYPDAITSEPPIDLTLSSHENLYNVESCEQIVTIEASSDSGVDNTNIIAIVKPEKAIYVESQNQKYQTSNCYAAIRPNVDIKLKESNETVTLERSLNAESRNVFSLDARNDKNPMIFFRYFHCFVTNTSNMLLDQQHKYSLLHDLSEKLVDFGVEKLICYKGLYYFYISFDSVSAFQDAFEKIHSCYLEPLGYVNAQEIHKQEVMKRINLCITETLRRKQEPDLHCFVIEIDSQFGDIFRLAKMRKIQLRKHYSRRNLNWFS